ncbi:hypothetical protein J6590_086749 [Homalodisca vitripennis]|nr:hypothetical protein J6590_086749 [Homalodisca vitripennis]
MIVDSKLSECAMKVIGYKDVPSEGVQRAYVPRRFVGSVTLRRRVEGARALVGLTTRVQASSRRRAPPVCVQWGDRDRRRERVGAEPSSTDKSRTFLTNPVHAADSDLSSERF